MVLKSEGQQIKYVSEPARDKKYALVAFARLLTEYATTMPMETQQSIFAGLVELSSTTKQ